MVSFILYQKFCNFITLVSSKVNQCQPILKNFFFFQRDDEIARLKREIQRYRLELSNRESNFNRVFAGQKPVLVETKGGKGNSTPESVGKSWKCDFVFSLGMCRKI